MFDYPVTLTPDGGSLLVTFIDVPEAITFGNNENEALLNAVDALESALSMYLDARKPLPKASKAAFWQHTVSPSEAVCAQLGAYHAMTGQERNLNEPLHNPSN